MTPSVTPTPTETLVPSATPVSWQIVDARTVNLRLEYPADWLAPQDSNPPPNYPDVSVVFLAPEPEIVDGEFEGIQPLIFITSGSQASLFDLFGFEDGPEDDPLTALSVALTAEFLPDDVPDDVVIRQLSRFSGPDFTAGTMLVENLGTVDEQPIPQVITLIGFDETQWVHIVFTGENAAELQALNAQLLASLERLQALPTFTPPPTLTVTPSVTASPTPTITPSETITPTPTGTPDLDATVAAYIAATEAAWTDTPSPTAIVTVSPTPAPALTWTTIELPDLGVRLDYPAAWLPPQDLTPAGSALITNIIAPVDASEPGFVGPLVIISGGARGDLFASLGISAAPTDPAAALGDLVTAILAEADQPLTVHDLTPLTGETFSGAAIAIEDPAQPDNESATVIALVRLETDNWLYVATFGGSIETIMPLADGVLASLEALPAPATATPPSTATAIPPTETMVPPTNTLVPPTATALPSATPAPPTATAVPITWVSTTIDNLGLEVDLPDSFTFDPGNSDDTTAAFSDPPTGVLIGRYSLAALTGGAALSPADEQDPAAVLTATLATMLDSQAASTVLAEPGPLSGLNFPAAYTRLELIAGSSEMAVYVVQLGEADWALIGVFGPPAQVDRIGGHVVSSLRPLPVAMTPTFTPTVEPTVAPTEPPPTATTAPTEAPPTEVPPTAAPAEEAALTPDTLGLSFAMPENWTIDVPNLPGLEDASLIMGPEDGAGERLILLARGSSAQLGAVGFPPEEDDPVAALRAVGDFFTADDEELSGGRVREITLNTLSGAWTQYSSDTHTIRLYLFPVSADDWLLVGASAQRDDFNTFNQSDLNAFWNSLEVEAAAAGVALGLDFTVPEGWTINAVPREDNNAFAAEAVSLVPPDGPDDPARRIIGLARGSTADFADGTINFPPDATDAETALQPVAEYYREQYGVNSVRVEPFQMGDFAGGAFASLRADATMLRLYLFLAGEDDWVLMIAEANRDDFNAFNRMELRDVLNSLSVAAGGEPLRIEPIGPIEEATVLHVSDGDTIYVDLNGVEESIRIIGIDTPEAHHPDSGAEWLGYAATHFMADLVGPGDTVWLESDLRDRDDFARLLRYVWIRDEADNWVMIEAELIRAGMANVRTYDEDRYVGYFLALEREAQRADRGIWGDPPPAPPVDPIAEQDDTAWALNPDGENVPLLYDAAALGIVPDPIAFWPNGIVATVRDTYYVYPDDIDPQTGDPVSEDAAGWWYWLEINDFRGWIPEEWLLIEEPETVAAPPETDIIGYAEPFVTGDFPLDVWSEPGAGEIIGTLAPGDRAQVERLSIGPDPLSGEADSAWWLWIDIQGLDGWVPLDQMSRMRPE